MNSYFSMSVSCKVCGFTNRYFPLATYKVRGQRRYSKRKICVECYLEKHKVIVKRSQKKPEYKIWRIENINKNINRIRELNKIGNKNYRKRKASQKRFDKLRQFREWQGVLNKALE